jgi:hypothetical protein
VETRQPDKREGSQAGRSIRGCSPAIEILQATDNMTMGTDRTQMQISSMMLAVERGAPWRLGARGVVVLVQPFQMSGEALLGFSQRCSGADGRRRLDIEAGDDSAFTGW